MVGKILSMAKEETEVKGPKLHAFIEELDGTLEHNLQVTE